MHTFSDIFEPFIFSLFATASSSIVNNNTIQKEVSICFIFTARLEDTADFYFLFLYFWIITMCTNWNNAGKLWNVVPKNTLLICSEAFHTIKRVRIVSFHSWNLTIWCNKCLWYGTHQCILSCEHSMNAGHPLS